MRLFFALWPPRETAQALGRWAREVQEETGGRATAEETIHLTLAFLGDADPSRATAAARRVQGAKFHLPIETASYWAHNDIVWAGPRATPAALASLVADLQLALYREEFIMERRPFAAHITLLRKAGKPSVLPELPRVAWPATEFLLVRSATTPNGPRYETLDRFPLQADA